jgi:hypothetical protein
LLINRFYVIRSITQMRIVSLTKPPSPLPPSASSILTLTFSLRTYLLSPIISMYPATDTYSLIVFASFFNWS